jgi:hypothetical protein
MLKVVKLVVFNIIAFVLILSVLEGAASLLFAVVRVHRATGITEQQHSVYDPTIGWVSLPNVRLPDLYGPGIRLHTNARAFRGDHDIEQAVPPGKIRVICSGDSFTLGYGVRDNETWCHQLSVLDPRLETVNMGQGGYGLDQAYLWYKRAGLPLDHQVHIVAFITDDFLRMQFDDFVGYGKPLLGLRGDSIAVLNAPVPKRSWVGRWWLAKGQMLMNLNILQLLQRVVRDPPTDRYNAARNDSTRAIVARIFRDLARINAAKNSRLVLVYLPGASDYRRDDPPPSWRSFVTEEAARQGIQLIDLFEPLRRLPPTQIDRLYLQDGHYSARGNEFVARAIYGALAAPLGASAGAAAAH